MKIQLIIAAPLLLCCGVHAQVAPSATGGKSNFDYVLRYSESAQAGGSYGNWQTVSPSVEVQYSHKISRAPFSVHYAGGYTWTLAGPDYTTGWFQRFSIAQGLYGRKWQASLADDVSYLPQTPITGFSGIPGIGEPIGTPTPTSSNPSVLTLGTYTLYNNAAAEATRILTGAYSVRLGGSYSLLRFPDANGLDTDSLSANGALTRRLNARNFLSGEYTYTRSSYPGTTFTFTSTAAKGIYERDWSRTLHTSIALGPEWINSSLPQLVPASTMLAVDASATRLLRHASLSLNYDRGTNGGSGYMLGGKNESVSGGYSRDFESKITIEMTAGYYRSTPLTQSGTIESEFGGGQLFWHFNRHVSAFVNYTVMAQSTSEAVPGNVVQHPLQVLSFGTTFEPRNPKRR